MRIWIDADACPKAAKELVCKFALKRKLEVWMVAGQPQVKPPFACVRLVVVESGMDAADDYLVEQAEPGDLAICSDVPLADRLDQETGCRPRSSRPRVRRAEHGR
ncbi:YaiI/YqxD family protein [Pseudomonas aeruginosa]|nr:YaiI/YqxD family protein [Pseudomonas aeruginosa]